MRRRYIKKQFYLNEKENEKFKMMVKKTCETESSTIRWLINGYTPIEMPPEDYFTVVRKLSLISSRLNMLAIKLNSLGYMDVPEYRATLRKLGETVSSMTGALVPRKNEKCED